MLDLDMPAYVAKIMGPGTEGCPDHLRDEGEILYVEGSAIDALKAFNIYVDVMGIEGTVGVSAIGRVPKSGYKPLQINMHELPV